MENEDIEIDGAAESGAAVKKRISGKKITLIIIASLLAALVLAVGLFFCVGACTGKKGDVSTLKEGFTIRKTAPTDGSLPTDHAGIDNIAYMAYVLDNQQFYHAYAKNSTKSTGVEQITQTWKDYKSAAVNGTANNVMVCSDLSYSTLIRSATQTCFVGDSAAYMRSGNKPKKDSVPSNIEWSTNQPEYYSQETYLKKYGEFSTELSVYALNEETVASCDDVIDNGNGTYTQKFVLNADAACWYQYGMKTRGGLKSFPEFEKIEITFTFDGKWQVLESVCEEKAKISPVALGGNSVGSSSRTTTSFDYSDGGLDSAHFSYFDRYFEQYVGKDLSEGPSCTIDPDFLTVLGEGFSEVMGANGQRFTLGLTIGQTEYVGKAYAKLGDISDILGSLNIRLALEKAGSGKQDLFIEFANGAIDVYYSDNFALTANIDETAAAVTAFSEWVKGLGKVGAEEILTALAEAEDGENGGLDFESLLASLKLSFTDNSVTIAINSDDLLGLGVGVDVQMNFDRFKNEDGETYAFKDFNLSSLSYNSTPIDLAVSLVPDESTETVSRDKTQTPANLADYINGVKALLESKTYLINIGLDGSSEIEYIKGLTLSATAQVKQDNGFNQISVNVPLTVALNGVAISLEAYYTIDLTDGSYGEVYLNVISVNGVEKNFKVYCEIFETVDAVKEIIGLFKTSGAATLSDGEDEANTIANAVNLVLNLDFGAIICDLKADRDELCVTLDVDKILSAVKVDLGVGFGELVLTLLNGEGRAALGAKLAALGLNISLCGSDDDLSAPDENDYIDAKDFTATAREAAVIVKDIMDAQDIVFTVNGLSLTVDGVKASVDGKGEVIWNDGKIIFAADLNLIISEGDNNNTATVKFVYNDAEEGPLVRFTVNGLGFEIYQSDIDGVEALINDIANVIGGLVGNANATALLADEEPESGEPVSIDYVNIVTTVLKLAGNLSVDLRGDASLKDLFIAYASNVEVLLGANGGLSLDLIIKNNSTEILGFDTIVNAGGGETLKAVNAAMNECTFKDAETFLKGAYDYLFDLLEEFTVKNLLGSDTYTVEVTFNGSESGIEALDGINVNANLYYDEINSKLIEADLVLDIYGTQVEANAYYTNRAIYVTLLNIGGTKLDGVAFTTGVENIYEAAKTLVEIITSEKVAGILSTLTGEPVQPLALAENESTSVSLTKVINYFLTLDIDSVITLKKVDGKNTLTVKPDGILEAFGVDIKIGTVYVEVDPATHSIYASVGDNKWLTLNAQAVENSGREAFTPENFIDIGFISTLLEDIKTTLENTKSDKDGNYDVRYSFTGSISVNVSIVGLNLSRVNITETTVTLGFDGDNEFYFSFYGHLQQGNAILGDLSKNRYISVTYSNGYITFGIDVKSNPKYRVMTTGYLVDNLIDNIFWLLGTDSIIKGIVKSPIESALSGVKSGLTDTKDFYLYDATLNDENANADKEKSFSLSELLTGLLVKVGGYENGYGNDIADELNSKFGLTDNFYAAGVNVTPLLGSEVLKNVYAAILRGEDGGIAGLDAYLEVDSYLKVTVSLDKGVSYKHVQNYYKTAVNEYGIDVNYGNSEHKTFGCYDTQNGTYSLSEINRPYKLKIYGVDGVEYGIEPQIESFTAFAKGDNLIVNKTLNSGSKVYLLKEELWLDDNHKLIFIDGNGNDLGLSFTITENTEVYAIVVSEKGFTFHYGDGETFNANFTVGESLDRAELNNLLADMEIDGKVYTFAGWYTEDGFVHRVTSVQVADNYFAKYIEKQTTADNGVVYEFTFASSLAEGGYYTAVGFGSGTDGKDYSDPENILILSDYINGYPVTAIGGGAFRYDDTGISLKKIIVPETVTTVGAEAFKNNADLQFGVFLADALTFTANSWDNGENIYYNGGDRQWAYVTFNLAVRNNTSSIKVAELDFSEFVNGINTVAMSQAEIQEYILAKLNSATEQYGYINAFRIYVSRGLDLNGKMYTVEITITEKPQTDWYYSLSVTATYGGEATSVTLSGDTVEFNGKYYVDAGSTVELTAMNGLAFSGYDYDCEAAFELVLDENGRYVFEMPAGSLVLNVNCVRAKISEVKLISAIEGSYGDDTRRIDGNGYTVTLESEQTVFEDPYADGYEFLGWAYDKTGTGENLTFTSNVIITDEAVSVYYAVWAVERDEIKEIEGKFIAELTNPNAEDGGVSVTVKDTAAGFCAWYASDDADYETMLESITVSTTVLKARLEFRVSIFFDASSGSTTKYTVTGGQTDSKTQEDYTLDVVVTEGDDLSVMFAQQQGSVLFDGTYYWNNCVVTYNDTETTVAGKKNGTITSNKDNRRFTIEYEGKTYTTGDTLTLTGISCNINLTSTVDSAIK